MESKRQTVIVQPAKVCICREGDSRNDSAKIARNLGSCAYVHEPSSFTQSYVVANAGGVSEGFYFAIRVPTWNSEVQKYCVT